MRNGFALLTLAALLMLSVDFVYAETAEERKARLELELQNVERQILKQQVLVEDTTRERQSLERDVALLDAEIEKARLGIKARNVAIAQLGDQIVDKEGVIVELNDRLDKQRQSLAQLIRKTQEIDDYSLAEVILGKEKFSEFFEDLESFQSIKSSLNESVHLLKEIRIDTKEQRDALEDKQLSEAEMKRLQEVEKKEIEVQEAKKEEILTVTRGQESEYKQLLESQQKTASQLRAALFDLSGGGGAIPFPEAVGLAEFAGGQTGVAPALVLAILEQESAYGSNIGSCVYDDIVQGRAVMKPDRDQPVFIEIAKILGFDPRSQQVSCPWIRSGERLGWGGAMGPSQFIPSTWAMYGGIVRDGSGGWVYEKGSDMIRSRTGKASPSNPFNNQDAFMATALLMRDNGAAAGTYAAERLAALRYFAGWGGASNPVNAPYGDGVMKRKARLENEIRILRGG
ncbi:MAG: lytic murein transglycosylase [Candidatus Pacebacteria bacterium]|nr:lytic murein transglycosylase [Candidatus Paceibacterota bacterium]